MKLPEDFVLSTKAFIISHTIILLSALLFFAGLYYILYQDKFTLSPSNYIPVTKEPVSLFLEVGTPEDDILVYEDNVLVTGRTGPDSPVIISTQNTVTGFQSGRDGQFSKVIELSQGPNDVEITAFDDEGNLKTVTKQVFYSEEELQ